MVGNNDSELLLPESENGQVVGQELNTSENNSIMKMFSALATFSNPIVYILLGSKLTMLLWFVFKDRFILSEFKQHILFCVLGYQLLMAQAIFSLSYKNNWLISMRPLHRRRLHWLLQMAGSCLAITGSAIMIKHKTVNFTTTHGKLALSALVFTCIGLLNGLTSLYATEIRQYIPPNISKLLHVSIGMTAFVLSSVCLCFGYNKNPFTEWTSDNLSYLMICVTAFYTIIIIMSPLRNIFRKCFVLLRNLDP